MNMSNDNRYMQMCLDLAEKGYGSVHPNPMVGAVLVKEGEVIATGFHKRFGGAHAELDCLRKAGQAARGGSLYVNLEPCVHHGKTPPCAEAIIAAGVREVIVAMKDPNAMVNGRGLAALRKAGIRVRSGVMRKAAQKLNERFIWSHTRGLPYVGLKWAQSLDGFVADSAGRSKWITGKDARRYAHHLRSGYHAVMVGAGTVRKDDPQLTVRHVSGRDPVRIILDAKLAVTGKEKVFRHTKGRTILVTSPRHLRTPGKIVRRLLARGVEVIGLDGPLPFPPARVLRLLAAEGITSILIEGGPMTIRRFFDAQAFNVYHVFIRSALLGGGMPALPGKRPVRLVKLGRTSGTDLLMFRDGDLLVEGGPHR